VLVVFSLDVDFNIDLAILYVGEYVELRGFERKISEHRRFPTVLTAFLQFTKRSACCI